MGFKDSRVSFYVIYESWVHKTRMGEDIRGGIGFRILHAPKSCGVTQILYVIFGHFVVLWILELAFM